MEAHCRHSRFDKAGGAGNGDVLGAREAPVSDTWVGLLPVAKQTSGTQFALCFRPVFELVRWSRVEEGDFFFVFPGIFGFGLRRRHGSKPYSTPGEELWIIPGVC